MTEYMREDKAVCPHCDYIDEDSWEYDDCECEEHECGSCGEKFILTTETERLYTTKKISCEEKHSLKEKPTWAFITTQRIDWTKDYKTIWIPLLKEDWKYNEKYSCENCDEEEYKEITEEEFKEKYNHTYEDEIEKLEKRKNE